MGRSPRERKGYPLQYSGLEFYTVHGVTKSQTQLSDSQKKKKKKAFDAIYKKNDLWVIIIRCLRVFGQYIYKTFIMYTLLDPEIPIIGIYPKKKKKS